MFIFVRRCESTALIVQAFTSYKNLPIAGMLVGEVLFAISMLLAFTGASDLATIA